MDLPEFPLWALPAWLGEYCASLAEATQTPPDMAACLALAVLPVVASGKVRTRQDIPDVNIDVNAY